MTRPSPQWPDTCWNDTQQDFDRRVTLPELIQVAAANHPDRPALITDAGVWCTHRQLQQRVNQMARLLLHCGVQPGSSVALVGHHDPETIVAMLAVGTVGASYVPLDPSWPNQRVASVLSITKASLVVGRLTDLNRVGAWKTPWLTHLLIVDATTLPPSVPVPSVAGAAGFPAARAETVAAAVAGLQPGAVLQLGLDGGELFTRLQEHVSFFCGLDPRPEAVNRLVDLAQRSGTFADFTTAPLQPAHTRHTFDVAVFAAAHQTEVATTLTALAAVVREDGHAVVYAPTLEVLEDLPPGWFLPPCSPPGVWLVHRAHSPAEPARIEVLTATDIDRQPSSPLQPLGRPDDMAYTIFTSGSTGQPKGVAVAHRAVVNLIEWMTSQWDVGADDRVLLVTSFSFDLSVYDVFGLLAVGGAVRILDDSCLSEPSRIAEALCSSGVTVWDSAPAALAWVLPFVSADLARGSALRLVILSGDWIPVTMPDELRHLIPTLRIAAQGGATEAAVWSNYFDVGTVDPQWPSIPYGRPIQNARYYVLDAGASEVPVGQAGDLFIAGDCLADGYFGAPSQTASRFVADPHQPGARMYATGDRARWQPEGTLQFLGRIDHQVKIRGYRVELGEVESALASVAGVRAAVVVPVVTGGGNVLVAFYTSVGGAAVENDIVISQLKSTLPTYMIPHLLIAVDSMPLTANGKIDRPALVSHAERRLARS